MKEAEIRELINKHRKLLNSIENYNRETTINLELKFKTRGKLKIDKKLLLEKIGEAVTDQVQNNNGDMYWKIATCKEKKIKPRKVNDRYRRKYPRISGVIRFPSIRKVKWAKEKVK